MTRPSDQLRTLLRQRIDETPAPTGLGDWPRALAREHRVLLIDGDNLMLWFIDENGTLYEVDSDRAMPRLEQITHPSLIREVLERACAHLPELAELLAARADAEK